jgi:hypothetical protein
MGLSENGVRPQKAFNRENDDKPLDLGQIPKLHLDHFRSILPMASIETGFSQ